MQQEHDLGSAQAAIPAARPVSHTLKPIAAPQRLSAEAVRLDQGTRRPYRSTEAAIVGAMQALQAGGTQGQRDEALQALQAALQGQDVQDSVGITQGTEKRGRPVGSKDNASRKKKP